MQVVCGRIDRYSNEEIAEWIREYGAKKNYTTRQITTVLRRLNIEKPRRSPDPTMVICPKCDKRGMVSEYNDPRNHNPISYRIIHWGIEGTWGKTGLRKRKRCYITDPKQIEELCKRVNSRNVWQWLVSRNLHENVGQTKDGVYGCRIPPF